MRKIANEFLTDDAYRPFVVSSLIMVVIFCVGTIGFTILSPDHSMLDAAYMTVITLTTVGYGEVIPVAHHPWAQFFTMFLLLTGVGTFLYFFSSMTSFIVEGNVERLFRRRKMQKKISQLKEHYIVCGGEFIARHVIRELVETERDLVLIAPSEAAIEDIREHARGADFAAIVGDPTHDDRLMEGGIERASGIFACLDSDKDNLILTVSARMLNPNIRIVVRCVDEDYVEKIRKAGADQVISPPVIGGLRMASAMVRPTVVSFLDVMLRDEDRLRVEESTIEEGSSLSGSAVAEFRRRHIRDALLIAVRQDDGAWLYNPDDSFHLVPGTTMIYMCSPGVREAVEKLCQA